MKCIGCLMVCKMLFLFRIPWYSGKVPASKKKTSIKATAKRYASQASAITFNSTFPNWSVFHVQCFSCSANKFLPTILVILFWIFQYRFHLVNVKNFIVSFLWTGPNCLKASEPQRGDSLSFTTRYPDVPVTHLINIGRMKGWVEFRAIEWS